MRAFFEKRAPFVMVFPTLIVLLIIAVVPLIYVLRLSFTESTLSAPFKAFIGFDNFARAFSDETFGRSLVNTLFFAFTVTLLETLIGFVMALAFQSEKRLGGVVRTLALLPLFTPPVAIAMIWRLIYDPNSGLINHYLNNWGILETAVGFLGNPQLAMPAIMLADIWQWTPFTFLLCLAALQALPKSAYEAANVDGASNWQIFRRLTLPLVSPAVIVIFLFRFLIALKVFDLVFILTYGGPGSVTNVASFYIYRVGFTQFNTGYAAALSILVLLLISVVTTFMTVGRDLILKRLN
ncbi:MAG: sugar ABC transporter permease [Chloroflexi bacterium]|nr:MAG: sugar ABC transporter permease [Chloroflexota bacterium]MBL1193808.1 sugar ABC transporter permease [Chloroflexota bacterium]NOH11101.1 sugar ABC transporter permease [Chloroflexota bacterium]